jgi:tRNA-dihydrouridine synthase
MDFKNKLIFAPLAGISDFIFREICKKNGADIVMSEMINVNGLIRLNKKTLDMLKFNNSERPFGLQIFGDDIKEFKQACIYIDKHIKPDFIDINCGCPVPKVVNHNAGAALLKNPKKIYEIIKSIKLVTKIPVTIKIRSG